MERPATRMEEEDEDAPVDAAAAERRSALLRAWWELSRGMAGSASADALDETAYVAQRGATSLRLPQR